jgi:hypothetical protein
VIGQLRGIYLHGLFKNALEAEKYRRRLMPLGNRYGAGVYFAPSDGFLRLAV